MTARSALGPIQFAKFRVKLDDLTVAIGNRIDREQFQSLKSKHGLWPTFLRNTAFVSRATFHTILAVVHDKRDGEPPPFDIALAVPVLNRTFVDSLYTLVFIADDVPLRARRYLVSGWQAATEYHASLFARYGADPEHADWFRNHQAWIDSHLPDVELTTTERQNPRLLRWPNPGAMRRDVQAPVPRAYLDFLDEWFYGLLSQDAHLSYMGLARRASWLIANPARESMQLYREQTFTTALALYLAVLSEVIAEAKLPIEARAIETAWRYFAPCSHVRDLWNERYERLLAGIA